MTILQRDLQQHIQHVYPPPTYSLMQELLFEVSSDQGM